MVLVTRDVNTQFPTDNTNGLLSSMSVEASPHTLPTGPTQQEESHCPILGAHECRVESFSATKHWGCGGEIFWFSWMRVG